MAPCDVFFDARATRDADHDASWKDLIDLHYAWTFGDPDSGIWRHGASKHSRDLDTGFVAGHVYDRPGRYTATVRVTDLQGESATARAEVQVRDPDEVWKGEWTVCVRDRDDGDFAGCPAGARQVTTRSFDEALRALRDSAPTLASGIVAENRLRARLGLPIPGIAPPGGPTTAGAPSSASPLRPR